MTSEHHARMTAVADRFFGGIERGDIETVKATYHPDVRVWLNTNGIVKTRDENIAVLTGLVGKTTTRHYRDRDLTPTPDGFIQRHVLHAVHTSGPVLELPAILLCKVDGDRIIDLAEYFDSAPLLAWYAAIEAAA